ncbi:MAG: TetR/AcrR family transcriptional regulator [Pseudomonadota bacterium]
MLGARCDHDSKRGKRREAMLCAAHELFVEKGFDATTLNDIVRHSGGSLATLYDMFENKPGLLRALVTERCVTSDGALQTAMATQAPLDQSLRAIAEEMLDRFLDPTYVGLFRVVIAQCIAHPDLGRQIYDSGPVICQVRAADFFREQMAKGAMAQGDPIVVSILFFQMICGNFLSQLAFGLPVELTPAQRTTHLDQVLPIFTKAFAPT